MTPSSRKPTSAALPRICKWMSLAPARSASRTRFSKTSGAEGAETFSSTAVWIFRTGINLFSIRLGQQIAHAVRVQHEHMQAGFQPRELHVEMAFLFCNGQRHGLERMKLDADQHQRHGQRRTARPREPRTPGVLRREVPALASQLHAEARRKIVPILVRALRHGN